MFKSYKIFIQFFRNKVRVINMETGEEVTRPSEIHFSSERQVLSNFSAAAKTVRDALKELGIKNTFLRPKIVIQQAEGAAGGLSDIEKRMLRDLAEEAGANKVYIVDHDRPFSLNDALQLIS